MNSKWSGIRTAGNQEARVISANSLLCMRSTFSKSVMVSVAVSKLGRTNVIFCWAWSKRQRAYYRDVLLMQELLDLHHCWRRVCLPARQCTSTSLWRHSRASTPWDTPVRQSCHLDSQQSCSKSGRLPHLGHDAGGRVSSTNPRYGRVVAAACWEYMSWISAERGGRRHWSMAKRLEACVHAECGHFEHLLWRCSPDIQLAAHRSQTDSFYNNHTTQSAVLTIAVVSKLFWPMYLFTVCENVMSLPILRLSDSKDAFEIIWHVMQWNVVIKVCRVDRLYCALYGIGVSRTL